MKSDSFFEAYKRLPVDTQFAFVAACLQADINPMEIFHTLDSLRDAVRDGLTALVNSIEEMQKSGLFLEDVEELFDYL